MTRESFPDGDESLDYSDVEEALGPPRQYLDIQTHARGRGDMFKNAVHIRVGNDVLRVEVETLDNQELFGEWPSWARPNVATYPESDVEDNDLQPGGG
jgi:hypothetical protein